MYFHQPFSLRLRPCHMLPALKHGSCLMDSVNLPCKCVKHIEGIGHLLIFHLDQGNCLSGDGLRLCNHAGNPVPHISHMGIENTRSVNEILSKLSLILVVLFLRRVEAVNNIDDPRKGKGFAAVQMFHNAVRYGTKQQRHMQHTLKLHVPCIHRSSRSLASGIVYGIAFTNVSHAYLLVIIYTYFIIFFFGIYTRIV